MVFCAETISSRKSSYPVNQENMAPVATAVYWEKREYAISSLIMLWWESEQSIYLAGQRAANV